MSVTLLFRSLLAIIFCSIAVACDNMRPDTRFEFYYYPSKNLYYDVSNALYVYSLNGGRNWDTFYKKMGREPVTLGKKQIIYSSVRDPWDSNEVHREIYGGYLLDIPDADSTTLQKNTATERKFPKKPKPVAAVPDQNTEKKPGFFKRLFGKKH